MTETKEPFKVKAWKYKGKSSSALEFKFLSGGVPFFGLVNPSNINQVRYNATHKIYQELERGIDDEKLNGFLAVIEDALWSKDEAKHRDALWLTQTLAKRSNVANYAYLAFKMASIYFVGQDEDFDTLNWDKAKLKVKHWMANEPDLDAFFLKTHVITILPFANYLNKNIRDFSELQRKMDNNELTIMLALLTESNGKTKSSTASKLDSVIASLTSRQWPIESMEPAITQ